MKNILLITVITFIGIVDASRSNDEYLLNHENYSMINLSVLTPQGKNLGSFVSLTCLNNYVFINNKEYGLVQFFRKKDDGTGSQPMTCHEIKRNLHIDRKGNVIE